jgi:hypothetical protein
MRCAELMGKGIGGDIAGGRLSVGLGLQPKNDNIESKKLESANNFILLSDYFQILTHSPMHPKAGKAKTNWRPGKA